MHGTYIKLKLQSWDFKAFYSVYSLWHQTPFYYQLNAKDLLYTYIWCVSATPFGVLHHKQGEQLLYFPAHKTHFFPEKCDLNSISILCAEGKYYFQTYKYPYIYIEYLYCDYDFSGSDDNFLGFYDK
jgi:hypothetical protein